MQERPTNNTNGVHPTFEERLDQFDGDPRVMATDAQMRQEGFIMKPNTVYDVTAPLPRPGNLIDLA